MTSRGILLSQIVWFSPRGGFLIKSAPMVSGPARTAHVRWSQESLKWRVKMEVSTEAEKLGHLYFPTIKK